MKYVSIDIETTGLDYKKCQILEFAAVVDDLNNPKPIEKLPKFQTYVKHKIYKGDPYALAMHSEIFKKLSSQSNNSELPICLPECLMVNFYNFLINEADYKNDKGAPEINVAGKNFANFDKRFIELLLNYNLVKFHHRVLDPSILYFEFGEDMNLPSTSECLRRANLPSEVKHTALEDAIAVVKLIRHKLLANKKIRD